MEFVFLLMEEGLEVFNMVKFQNNIAFAEQLDQNDPLKSFRQAFLIPENENGKRIYFLGNSLGLQPVTAKNAVDKIFTHWHQEGVESFFRGNEPWLDMHQKLQHDMAPIAGAMPREITIMNQLTVNIHLMLVSFYRPEGPRRKILMEKKAFPSDQYAVRSYLEHLGMNADDVIIEINSNDEDEVIQDEVIIKTIYEHGEELALVFWGGLNYYSGQVFDMKSITHAAHSVGALAGFDLAHAIGNVALQLHAWKVDFACWCSYKYLNAGPGAVSGSFIHDDHLIDPNIKRLTGWWGYDKEERFLMKNRFSPEKDASAWQLSTPSIISYACLDASLKIFAEAGWDSIQQKHHLMKEWMVFLLEDLKSVSVRIITPSSRGSQVSLLFSEKGKEIYDILFEKGFMVDWREPNVIRLAPVPLYNQYSEVYYFVETLQQALKNLHLQ
jgi:kynureninase